MTPRGRVLQVGKYYPPHEGGIENHVRALVAGLASRYDVTVLVFNRSARTGRETRDGARIIRAASLGRLFRTELAPAFLWWFLRHRKADIVHLHTPNPVGELACLALPRSARLIVTYHSDVVRPRILGRFNRLLLHRILRRADRIIAFTRRYMETSPVLSRYAEKCAIIPHGVDLQEMEPTPAIEERTARLRREHGPSLVLFVGRLVYYKGVDVLLRAMSRVPEARLILIGDGPMKDSLKALARKLGLGEKARFLGQVPLEEKIAWYHASDLLVLPATHRSEAFGLVQVEALACGLPVISTNINSGVPFVNRDGETGRVVEPANAEALADALRSLLGDKDLRARFGRAARRRARELFSRDVMMRDIESLYAEILKQPAGSAISPGAPGPEPG